MSRIGTDSPLGNTSVVKKSIELSKSSEGSLFWKSKLFWRFLKPLGSSDELILSSTLSAGFMKSLNKNQDRFRVNDAFYLQNFKGIKNLGYHFDHQSKKKGLGGDILGFDRFLNYQLKVLHQNCPLLNLFGIEPFLFANCALAPNRGSKKED